MSWEWVFSIKNKNKIQTQLKIYTNCRAVQFSAAQRCHTILALEVVAPHCP